MTESMKVLRLTGLATIAENLDRKKGRVAGACANFGASLRQNDGENCRGPLWQNSGGVSTNTVSWRNFTASETSHSDIPTKHCLVQSPEMILMTVGVGEWETSCS